MSISCLRRRQCGATAVEFALVMLLFFMPLMLGIVDFSRWLFAVNSAAEATRYGARIATVCDQNAAGVERRMRTFLPTGAPPPNVEYLTGTVNGCSASGIDVCGVRVTLSDVTIRAFLFPGTYPLPSFSTTLPRESLQTSVGGDANPLCT